MTVWAGMMNSEPSIGHRRTSAGRVGLAEAVADELDADDLAVLTEDFDRAGQELHPNAFALGLAQLLLVDDELGTRAPIDDRDTVRAVAQARPRAVHRGIATTDDDDVRADLKGLTEVRLLHEVDAVVDTFEVTARDIQGDRVHRPGGDGDGIEVSLQLLEADVLADGRVVHECGPEAFDEADVHLDRLARQPEGRDADEHRAAGIREAVVDGDLIALGRELAGDRDAGRSGPDDRDTLRTRRDLRDDIGDARRLVPFDQEPLHGADGQRTIDIAAAARALARGGADIRAHGRDRVRVARQDVALLEPPFGGEVQVAAAVRPHRTRFLALDVALEPGGVDGLDEEFLRRSGGQVQVVPSRWGWGLGRERRSTASVEGPNLPSAAAAVQRDERDRWCLVELTVSRVAATLADGERPDAGGHGPGHARSVNAGEFAFLAIGLVLGLASGAALVEVLRARPPAPREVKLTVTPDSVPRRRGATLSQDPFTAAPAGDLRGPADHGPAVGLAAAVDLRTAVRSPEPVGPTGLVPSYRLTPAVAGIATAATSSAMVGFRVDAGHDPVFQAMQRSGAEPDARSDGSAPLHVATAVALMEAPGADPVVGQDPGVAGSGGASPFVPMTVDGPCGEVRSIANERCEVAVHARAAVSVADDAFRSAQRTYDAHIARSEEAAAASDPRNVRLQKEVAQANFRDARGRAGSPDAIEAAAREWLNEINRINNVVRDAGIVAIREREAATAIAPSLERLSLEADAARIKAETAEAACVAAREAVADCVEAQVADDPPPGVPVATVPDGPGPGEVGPRPSGPEPFESESEPLAAALGAGQTPVIFLLLRGDTEAMSRTAARLSDDPAEQRRWQASLAELVDAVVAVAISQSAMDFPADHPFWGPFSVGQDRDIVAALSSLGFRFDGLGGWADERVPTQRDLSMALGYAGLDPMRIRHWPTEAEMGDLFANVTVAADEHLAGAAGDLTLGELVAMLGRRADGLAMLWNDWGRVRPLLLEDA